MTKVLADFVQTVSRFSRSANIERDHSGAGIDGYVPTGRALDVISRIAAGLKDPAAGRTFSITGPHGGGKSSLAVFLSGLLAASSSPEYKSAHSILESIDQTVDAELRTGMRSVKAGRNGFVRAFATARNEPVAATIARALHTGVTRQGLEDEAALPPNFRAPKKAPSTAEIRARIEGLAKAQPVLLVI